MGSFVLDFEDRAVFRENQSNKTTTPQKAKQEAKPAIPLHVRLVHFNNSEETGIVRRDPHRQARDVT